MYYKIQKPSNRGIDAIDSDLEISLDLSHSIRSNITSNTNRNIDLSVLQENERNFSNIFRFNGSIKFFSLLRGIIRENNNYVYSLDEFFTYYNEDTKPNSNDVLLDFDNMFNIYLVKKIDIEEISTGIFVNKYIVMHNIENVDIMELKITNDIYGDKYYNFIIDKDFEITENNFLLYLTKKENIFSENDIILGKTIFTQEDDLTLQQTISQDIDYFTYLVNNGVTTESINFYFKELLFIELYSQEGDKLNTLFVNNTHNYYINHTFDLTPSKEETTLFDDFLVDLTNIDYLYQVENIDEQC
jgi:hypothetical protein